MAENSGFFNAKIDANGEYDRKYTAEQFAKYFALFIGNGVYVSPSTQLQVGPVEDMLAITVDVGAAFINGYFYDNDSKLQKTLSNPDGVNPRIDRIVLRLDYDSRSVYVDVLEGIAAETPVAKDLTRNKEFYEIALADISIASNSLVVDATMIRDLRNNTELCGYVKGVIDQIDTTNLFIQFETSFNNWFEEKKSMVDGIFDKATTGLDEWIAYETEAIDTWFKNLKYNLSEDVAINLQFQIDDSKQLMFAYYNGIVAKKTEFNPDGTITETYPNGAHKDTVFNEDKSITETLTLENGKKIAKITKFNADGSISEEVSE